MTLLRAVVWVFPCFALAPACLPSAEGQTGGEKNGNPESELNDAIQLDDEGDPLVDPATDESIGVTNNVPGDTHIPLEPGGSMQVVIPFDAPNANVIGAGIRFGATGPIQVVNQPQAAGQTQGTLSFVFQVPDSVCANLSNICHDIKCYEFAVTSAGTISKANITAVALQCGNCDEPSCQELLDSCDALSVSGTWTGECAGLGVTVQGTFTFGIGSDGSVTGSYDGWDSGDVTGTVQNGQLDAVGGGAGGCQWTGSIGSTSASGSWNCPADDCSGTWSGTPSGGS
jgi:hypothetical protein